MLFPNSGSKPLKRLEAMTKRLLTDAFKDRFDTPNFFDISGFILHPKLKLQHLKKEDYTTITFEFSHISIIFS